MKHIFNFNFFFQIFKHKYTAKNLNNSSANSELVKSDF